jgi:hypothetical protein
MLQTYICTSQKETRIPLAGVETRSVVKGKNDGKDCVDCVDADVE